jgi:hypothetical protein
MKYAGYTMYFSSQSLQDASYTVYFPSWSLRDEKYTVYSEKWHEKELLHGETQRRHRETQREGTSFPEERVL